LEGFTAIRMGRVEARWVRWTSRWRVWREGKRLGGREGRRRLESWISEVGEEEESRL